METALDELSIHSCALAYRRGIEAPLRRNACSHAQRRYSIRIDFRDFFHSISPDDLLEAFRTNGKPLSVPDGKFLKQCLFVRVWGGKMGLPIGAPSSPLVSNVVMYNLDERLRALTAGIGADAVFTRYADDIVFSANARGACHRFHQDLAGVLPQIEHPKLEINDAKTVYSSRGTRRVISGLVVTPDGHVSLGRAKKRYIRKLMHEFERDCIDPADRIYLSGFLAFAMDVEPDFYNRLALKYTGETVGQALKLEG